ncbi:MAG: S53 family peptidase [Candidatus Sulfotelmatobacter sp.]
MYQEKAPLNSSAHVRRARTIGLSPVVLSMAVLSLVLLALTLGAVLPASAAAGQLVAHNTPTFVSTAKNLGAEDPAKTIEVSVWLNLHNRAVLDTLAQQLYDRTSPNYRHWLKNSDLARFAPTTQEAATVREFFESHNLKVVTTGPNNMFVRARGTVSDVQTAFHVSLNDYQVRGQIVRSNDRDPYVDGAAAPLVRSVSGLDTATFEHPMMARTITPPTSSHGAKSALAARAAAKPANITPADFFNSNCFDGTEKETFTTAPDNGGPLPIGTYSGNHLNLQSATSAGCAYTPPVIQTAYNLTGLYNEGYTGAGQTIAIIDWCGSPTILSDANAFSAQFGLPALTSSNFNIYNIPSPTFCEAPDAEINIDVEWAHAVAPGASINLIVPPDNSFQNIDESEYLTIYDGLGTVISGSYGAPEAFVSTAELETGSLLSELAAVYGISADFATGDDGDFSAFYGETTVSYPADSPWSTAVGGVSLALNADNSIAWQAGWGNNITELASEGYVIDPVYYGVFGFYGGAGGGPSTCVTVDVNYNCLAGFPKPAFQKSLPGKQRLLPDISWVADPYTGVAILISNPGQVPEQVWQVYGGTSVATPMFSALWAIANQESEANGGSALGQAAAHVYSLPAGSIFDVVPVSMKNNVIATIVDSAGTTKYTAAEVLGGPGAAPPAKFISAIWDYPLIEDTSYVISFGTDCTMLSPSFFGPYYGNLCNSSTSLHTKVGWDNVTGVGTPNAQAFADSFNPANASDKK